MASLQRDFTRPDAILSRTTTLLAKSTPVQPQQGFDIEEPMAPNEADVEYPSGPKLWLNITALGLTAFIRGIDTTIVAVAIPSITDEFKTINDIGWYTAAYMMTCSAFLFFFGKIYTVFSVRRTFQSSILGYMAAAVLCTFARNSKMFVVGRALGGFSGAWQGTALITQINMAFPLQKRPKWLGILEFVTAAGLVSAPLIGGGLIERFGWRACFGISIVTNAIAFPFALYSMREDTIGNPNTELTLKEKIKRLDFPGTLIFVPAVTCFLMALQMGGIKYGWTDIRILVLLILSLVLLCAFAYLQYRSGDAAAIPPRILTQRSILAGALFCACTDGALAVTENYLAIYFQGVRGYSPAKAGLLGVPMIIGLMIASILAGYGTSWLGYYTPFMIATSILSPIASGLLTTLDLDDEPARAAGFLAMLGFAIGIGQQAPHMAVSCILAPHEVAVGSAVVGFGAGMGSAVFSSTAALLFQQRLLSGVQQAVPQLNATQVAHAGLSEIRNVVGPDLPGMVLTGYDKAVSQTLYLPLGLTLLTIVGTVLTEWRSVKQKQA